MASSAKKRACGVGENPDELGGGTSEEESEEESEDEESSTSDTEINEEVVVDFEAHTISDNDHNGIKKLLQQLFLKATVDVSELANVIIQQNHIGSVIKQGEIAEESDDEDDDADEVFGFISMLGLTERKGVECLEMVKDHILSHCESEQLEKIFSDTTKPVGLLLSERFINVPPQIALPMYKQLQEEITEAQKTNKPGGKCHYYLMVSKTCRPAKQSGPGRGRGEGTELLFSNAEEEFFYEQATIKFSYSVEEETDSCLGGRWSFSDAPMKPYRTVMLVPTDRMDTIMDKLKEYLTV